MVKLGEMWGGLSRDQKKQYYNKAAKDKIRYLGEISLFQRQHPEEDIKNRTKKNHIKKPCSAYAIFVREMKVVIKKEKPQLKMADVLKIVAEKWKVLSDLERMWYQEKARAERECFVARMEANSSSEPIEGRSDEAHSEMMDEVREMDCEKRVKGVEASRNNNEIGSSGQARYREDSWESMLVTTRSQSRCEMVQYGNDKGAEGEYLEFPDLGLQESDLMFLKDRNLDNETNMYGLDGITSLAEMRGKRSSEVILDILNCEREMSLGRLDSGKENRGYGEMFTGEGRVNRRERLNMAVRSVIRHGNDNEYFNEREQMRELDMMGNQL
jgi:hypothetical protein